MERWFGGPSGWQGGAERLDESGQVRIVRTPRNREMNPLKGHLERARQGRFEKGGHLIGCIPENATPPGPKNKRVVAHGLRRGKDTLHPPGQRPVHLAPQPVTRALFGKGAEVRGRGGHDTDLNRVGAQPSVVIPDQQNVRRIDQVVQVDRVRRGLVSGVECRLFLKGRVKGGRSAQRLFLRSPPREGNRRRGFGQKRS